MIYSVFILDCRDYEERLRNLGIRELFFGLDTPEDVLARARRHFSVFVEFKPFESHGNFVENIFKERKDLKALCCPTNEVIWEANIKRLKEKLELADGVALDFVRYPSFSAERFFFSCFCGSCRSFAEENGFDFDLVKESASNFYNRNFKGSEYWFEFKRAVLKRYLEYFSGEVDVEKRAFIFSPSLSYFVGQDYDVFSRYVDELHPMIYPEGNLGPACLGYEAYHLSRLLRISLLEVYDLLEIKTGNLPGSREELLAQGLPEEVVYHEVKKLKHEAVPIVTTLNLPPERIKRRIELCRSAGAERVAIFGFNKKERENLVKACSG